MLSSTWRSTGRPGDRVTAGHRCHAGACWRREPDPAPHQPGQPADLPRGGAGRGQDLRHAERGSPTGRAGHRRGGRLRRDPRPVGTPQGQLGDLEVVPRAPGRVPGHGARGDGRRRRPRPRDPRSPSSTSWPTPTSPGRRNEKRWQDIEELLAAGIDVISTVNIQHLESLNDVVERITGVRQRETVPDALVRAADQIELVDMTPEALRRRMAHGNIYPAERIDAALGELLPPRQPRRRCASWPCCGWPTGSRTSSRTTWRTTASPTRGRPGSGCVVALDRGARRASAVDPPGRPASPGGCGASSSACTSRVGRRSVRGHGTRARCRTASSSRSWAAPTARWSATTWPRRWSRSPAPSAPPSSCSAPAAAAGRQELTGGSVVNRLLRLAGATSTCTSSRRGARGTGRRPVPRPAADVHRRRTALVAAAASRAWACSRCSGLPLLRPSCCRFRDDVGLADRAVAVPRAGGGHRRDRRPVPGHRRSAGRAALLPRTGSSSRRTGR